MNPVRTTGGGGQPALNRRMFRAAGTVALLSAGVKVVATLKELFVASYFGRGHAVDAFLIAFLVPSFLVTLIAGSFNAAVIPTYIEVREREGRRAALNLVSITSRRAQNLLLMLSLALAVIGPWLMRLMVPNFAPDKFRLALQFFYAMLPLIVLAGIATNCAALLNAEGCYWAPAIAPLLAPGFTLGLLLMRGYQWGPWALVAGVIAGAAGECVLLKLVLLRRGIRLDHRRSVANRSAAQAVRAQILPLLVAALLTSGVTVVDQMMASWLEPGSVAALAYGGRIVSALAGFTAVSLTAAAIPQFSEMVARQQWDACRDTLKTYTRLLIAVMLPATVLLIVGSQPIVRLLYERGAFTSSDTHIVSRVQSMYALHLPFYGAGLLYVRLLTAMKRNDVVMICAGINLALDVVLNLVCMKLLGVAGIALSTSLFYVFSLSFAAVMVYRLLPRTNQESSGLRSSGRQCALPS
jgi:putative peptidoglycan lipid II flippase